MEKFQNLIKQFQDKIWIPRYNDENIFEVLYDYERSKEQTPKNEHSNYKVYRVNLRPNETQRNNLLKTMKRTTTMYNETIKMLNNLRETNKVKYKNLVNFQNARKELLNFKHKLAEKNNTDIEILDGAIKHAVTAFKSAETNLKNGNIKKFEVKIQKQNRNNRVIEIDKRRFNCLSIIKNIFGEEIKSQLEDKIPFLTGFVNSSCLIRYTKQKGRFQLVVNQEINGKINDVNKIPNKTQKILNDYKFPVHMRQAKQMTKRFELANPFKIKLKEEIIPEPTYKFSSLDPGLTTFMTCLTEQDYKFYGEETYDKVKKLLKNIEQVNSKTHDKLKSGKLKKVTNRMKKKYTERIEKKISNIVNDLHWKTINDLTNNSKEIIIGNMSGKRLVQQDNFNGNSKNAILRMRYYEFRERLKYKCSARNRIYICVNESYTSKVCSVCTNYNEELKLSDRVYNCSNCGVNIQRDLNSCRGIWIKSMDKFNFRN